jgi:hypothetical protein
MSFLALRGGEVMDRRIGALVVVGVVTLAFGACHTILEEMPTGAAPTAAPTEEPNPTEDPNPTTKTPTPRSTARPRGTPRPTPRPTSKPRATPTKTKAPRATPNGCPHGPWPPSCAPVVKFTVYTFYLVCGGDVIQAKFATSGPANCYVQLDSTAKDASNTHTEPKGQPTWTFGGGYRTHIGGNRYMPKVYGDGKKGQFTVQGVVDGVTSNKLVFTFK